MNNTIEYNLTIPEECQGMRFDAAAALLLPDYSRAKLKAWIQSGELTLNQQTALPKHKVSTGDTLDLHTQLADEGDWQGENIPLNIVFEDESLIIINKPAGLVVHPAAGNHDGTLINALIFHNPELKQLPRAGIVHRLDKDTTGLMVVAKTLTAHQHLVRELQAREIERHYKALVYGALTGGGTVDQPMGRHAKNRLKMAVVHSGKPAVTHFRIAERFKHFTLCDVQLETGRTHQIRVHMAHRLNPIVGDPVYAKLRLPQGADETLKQALRDFTRQALHAAHLSLTHPVTGERLSFDAPLPEDMQGLLEVVRNHDH